MKNYFVILILLFFARASCQNIFTSLDSALVACYAFSGNANDLSGNGQNGIVNGAVLVADRFGNPNSAYSFAGYTNTMNITVPGFSSQLNGTGVSICFWTSRTVNAYDAAFLMTPDNTANRLTISVYYGTSSDIFWDYGNINSGGNGRLQSGTPLPGTNVWDHWVFTSGSNSMKVYKNGVLYASKTSASLFSSSPARDLCIGGGIAVSSGQLWYNGKLDDIRIYKRVLLATEISYLYNNNVACVPCPATPTPTNATSASTLCSANPVILAATGTPTLQWYTTGSTTLSIATGTLLSTGTPAGIFTYYVRSRNGCNSSVPLAITFTVNSTPAVFASVSTPTACAGQTMQLFASGATNYTWTPSNSQSATLSISPLVTTLYTLKGESGGCTGTTTVMVPVTSLPSVSVTASNSVVCLGKTTFLSASGAASYTWQPGNIQTPAISISPLSTSVYTVTGISAGCTNTAVITMPVINPPTVSISGSSLICLGNSALLLATGAQNYTWSPGNIQSQVLSISPTSNTTYSVTGEAGGCNNTAVITMSVVNSPTILITASGSSICPGSQASFTAAGAITYNWNNGNTAPVISVSPASATSYTVTGYGANNCSATAVVTVFIHTVSPITIAASSGSICAGETLNLTASGVASYTWSNGAQSNSVSLTPTITTTYSVTGADPSNGCLSFVNYVQYVDDCTGLSTINTPGKSFYLYPNPTTGKFIISEYGAGEVIICNSLGEVVYKNQLTGTTEIDLENMSKGIYMITLLTGDQTLTRKLIKE